MVKTMFLRSVLRLTSFGIALSLAGCIYFVSWDDVSQPWVGKPISDYIALYGSPAEVRQVDPLMLEYKFNLPKIDPGCVHYWLVNQSGIITSFHHKGYCRPIG
jgi:hypothetical protein